MARPKRRLHNEELANRFLEYFEGLGRSSATLYQYRQTLVHFLAWCHPRPMAELGLDDLHAFLNRPRERAYKDRESGGRATPATIARDAAALRRFFKFCASIPEVSGVVKNPAEGLESPTVRNKHPRAIPAATWTKLWSDDRLRPDERVVLGLGFFCGFRREEIVSLRRDHVDFEELRFVGFPRKGGGDDTFRFGSAVALFAERKTGLIPGGPASFLDPLHELTTREGGLDYVIPWADGGEHLPPGLIRHPVPEGQARPQRVNKRLRRALERCGLEPGVFTPHALRHSFVTYLLEAGVPIQTVSVLANHSSIDITMRYVKHAEDPLARYHNGLRWQPQTGRSTDA